jgi:hypothetical protein
MSVIANGSTVADAAEQLMVDRTYRGIAGIALGGYVGGLLAGVLDGPVVETTLRGAVRMERALQVVRPEPDRVVLSENGTVLAEARPAELDLEVPEPVSLAEADEASSSFSGLTAHPFPDCFACGTEREHGDGLRIFPGPVAGRELVAATWTPETALADPDGALLTRFAWAALDCPQLWALIANAPADSEEQVVTAAMTVRIESMPQAGVPHVVMAWPMHRSGRAIFAGGAILSAAGEVLVAALQRAVAVPGSGVPLGLETIRSRSALRR